MEVVVDALHERGLAGAYSSQLALVSYRWELSLPAMPTQTTAIGGFSVVAILKTWASKLAIGRD
jgi:hypothetical protein